jgi:nucleolar protein 9
MPKENKKRGRREAKRAFEAAGDDDATTPKRTRHDEHDEAIYQEEPVGDESQNHDPTAKPFYGLLDDEEQELFRNAMDTLNFHMDEFSEPGDLQDWVRKMYQHAKNKELKLANSQSCSRFLEMLIQLSTPDQLKALIQSFSGQYVDPPLKPALTGSFLFLCQHRFASHCVEALLENAAPAVTAEMASIAEDPSMEALILGVARELEPHVAWMLTDTFASHPLRVLLLVLAGHPLSKPKSKNVLHGRKKENISVAGIKRLRDDSLDRTREVPDSFPAAIDQLILNTVGGIDTDSIHWLSTHQSANPMLQLMLRLQLGHHGKQRAKDELSILHLLLPDDQITESSPSGMFVNSLIYSPVGSRLLEAILEVAPGKTFKAIYKAIIYPKLATLARNDVASYTVCTAVVRLGADDLRQAVRTLGPEFDALVERNRLQVIRTLVERCAVREIGSDDLTRHIRRTFAGPQNTFDISRLLQTPEATKPAQDQSKGASLHAALLVQSFLLAPAPLSTQTLDALSQLPPDILRRGALSPTHSHTLQTALEAPSSLNSPIQLRRLLGAFEGKAATLALDAAGARVASACWAATARLSFLRERIAAELARASGELLDSASGRTVWRAWRMDQFRSARGEWLRLGRQAEGGQGGGSALDRARQKHAGRKAEREAARTAAAE